jgi:hypothetical protein
MPNITTNGQSFTDALGAAAPVGGRNLATLPLSYDFDDDGKLQPWACAQLSSAQITAIEAVYAAWDPTSPSATLLRVEAQAELDFSDRVSIRCMKAVPAIPYPATWSTRDDALRAIVSGASSATTIPARPAYPSGD